MNDTSKAEQAQTMQFTQSMRVAQANQLIRGKNDRLTILQARLIRLAIAQIDKEDTEFGTYKVTVAELARLLNISKSHIDEDIKAACDDLAAKRIRIETGKDKRGKPKWKVFQWISCAEYDGEYIIIELHKNLTPYLLGLRKLFATYEYADILCLPNDYSVRLYEVLYSYRDLDRKGYKVLNYTLKEREIYFSIEQLRRFTDCEDKYTQNVGDYIKRVIDPSIKAINEKTASLKLRYWKLKDGRDIRFIIFKYLTQEEYMLYLIHNENLSSEKMRKQLNVQLQRVISEKSM